MKALEILNLKIIEQVLNSENREKLYEAISELEELQNRRCENCTHYARGLGCNLTFWQDYYSGYGFESKEDDFCSRWESK